MSNNRDRYNTVNYLYLLVLLSIILTVVITSLYFIKFHSSLSSNQSDWGTFGDYIGGTLNPIFGFFSLIALLITIAFQSRELHLSTQELRNSAIALRNQKAIFKQQLFESTFFNLLKIYNDNVHELILSSSNIDKSKNEFHGRECFQVLFMYFVKTYYNAAGTTKDKLEEIHIAFTEFLHNNQSQVNHYFQTIYSILLYLDESNIENKSYYCRILSSQFSSYELILLFYSCLSHYGEEYKLLLEKYHILANIDVTLLVQEDHKELYCNAAFMNN